MTLETFCEGWSEYSDTESLRRVVVAYVINLTRASVSPIIITDPKRHWPASDRLRGQILQELFCENGEL